MAALPESPHTTASAIVRWYESKPQEHRPHMGASLIGHACDRYIWSVWRWVLTPRHKGRILRLFDTGRREEARLLEELRGLGVQVWDVDPNTGDQWRVSAHNGHFGGSLDAVAKGLPEAPKSAAVLEFKTHSNKSFADLQAKKVAMAKPQHHDQMQVYMGLMEIDRALYLAVNKDTDEIYSEWVHADPLRFRILMGRAKQLIEATEPPQRMSDDPTFWQCKWCDFYEHCHQGVAAEANCRTCCHASPVENAAWRCEVHSDTVPVEFQRKGCDQHLLIPKLVPYAEPVDGGTSWVAYKHRETGAHFVNGQDMGDTTYGPCFTSAELHRCSGGLVPEAAEIKEAFPGAVVINGSVERPEALGTAFDDMESDDLDAVPTKAEHPVKRASRKRIADSLRQLEAMQ